MAFNPNNYLTDLRGKQYLEVAWRLVWFRDKHPQGQIITNMISAAPIVMRAEVIVDGIVVATGHGTADAGGRKVVWSGREIEKAETAAIGRALAAAGFGTQFSGEFDDAQDDHLADSPRQAPQQAQHAAQEMHVVVTHLNIKSDGKRPFLLAQTVDEHEIRIDSRKPFEDAGWDVSEWTTPGATIELEPAADILYTQHPDGRTQFVGVEPFDFD